MSKDNRYYLSKMQDNVNFILEHMVGVSKHDLENDPVLLDSMMLIDPSSVVVLGMFRRFCPFLARP